uniref:Neurotransmitter-gated ion-channel ligand-binding domain-containing protein n=1 Tax=Megaselia scalaris TaxID=36166 RepID=T1GCJ8_MEGSC
MEYLNEIPKLFIFRGVEYPFSPGFPSEWNDMNLRWNSSEYGGVRDLRIPPHRLWKPDVLMYNRFELWQLDIVEASDEGHSQSLVHQKLTSPFSEISRKCWS